MPHPVRKLLLPTLTALACCTAFAAQPIIYPAKGQSLEQQKRDDPSKNATGLFFFRGKPGAPFAGVCPGGGFS